jgi:hypothetical protein
LFKEHTGMITVVKFVLGMLFVFAAVGTGDTGTASLWTVAGIGATGVAVMLWGVTDINKNF